MKIFYITYWGVKDGLSVSTVYPNLQILSQMEGIQSIDYFTVERSDNQQFKDALPPIAKVVHYPIPSKSIIHHIITKILDWRRINQTILSKAKEVNPDLIICRGAMSGPVGTLLYKKLGIPYVVESFEPHADYMAESAVWKKGGLKYNFQQRKEEEVKKYASHIITVSHNYYKQLLAEGVESERLSTVPCVVDASKFAFKQEERTKLRNQLAVTSKTKIGLYLGKFGGIYYDQEAFQLFKQTEAFFQGAFYLILLTPEKKELVEQKLKSVDFPLDKVWIGVVPHAEVPNYLSAADFAFSTIKPADCRKFCSPIKDGEYWANGLPILIPDGVGDDSDIIKKEGGGAIVDVNDKQSIQNALNQIETIIGNENHRKEIRALAIKHRNPAIGEKVYYDLIKGISRET